MKLTPLFLLLGAALHTQAAPALDTARIDAVFAAYTDKTPGCALGITQGGQAVYAKGYGQADLNHGIAIRPDTVFDIGSVSKQFTALALLLLEQDGKLRLDDTMQQHLPELAALFPQRITLRQLLNHTAGLRDYNELMILAGHAEENLTGDAEALAVIRAAPALNFAPGSQWSYSNTGYFLAAQIVQRVSGGSLDAFLQARVFQPLGMKATHVRTDHRQVVAGRATAYAPAGAPGTFGIAMSDWNQAGDGAVQSTVQDLARWDAELLKPTVLPAAVLKALHTPGRLADGTPIVYALGLSKNLYRGAERISHGGAWAGYRAMLAQFPAQQTGVQITCNVADANVGLLLQNVADAVLSDALPEAASAPATASTEPPAGFDAQRFYGAYLHSEGHGTLRLSADTKVAGGVRMQVGFGNSLLRPAAADALQNANGSLRLQLAADGRELRLSRRVDPTRIERYQRLPAFTADAKALAALAGSYRQAALGAALKLELKDGALQMKAGSDADARPLQLLAPDLLSGPGVVLRIERDAKGRVKTLVYSSERVRGLRYTAQP